MDIKTRAFSFPKTINEKTRSCRAVIATEDPVPVWDQERWDITNEVLISTGVVIPQAGQVPLLDAHNRGTIRDICGSARDAVTASGGVEADIYFSRTPEGERAFENVKSGHLTDLSVGYKVLESTWIPAGKSELIEGRTFEGPVRVTTKWGLKEVSLTPIGADANAKIRSEADMLDKNREEEIRKAERERVLGIRDACHVVHADDLAEDLVRSDLTLEQARSELIKRLKGRNPPISGPSDYGQAFHAGQDESDKRRSAIIDGIALRSGVGLENPAPGATEYAGTSLLDIAQECLTGIGVRLRGFVSKSRIAELALRNRSFGAHGTGDFPALMGASAERILRATYQQAPSTWRAFCTVGQANDFREMERIQISEAPELDLLNEHEEYKHGSLSESKAVLSVHKYGKIFSVTWEAIVNDDLGAFAQIPKAFGMSAARKVNDVVYGILTTNPTMSDGKPLFHADHGNLAAGGDVGLPDVLTLDAARQAIRTQTGLNGAILNLAPKYLVGPAALETTIDQILNSISLDDANSGKRNPFYRKLEPIVDALLDQDSNRTWYLIADPRTIDTIEVAFLHNSQAPDVIESETFGHDSVEYKCRFVFGAAPIDHRGFYKNPGA